MPANPQPPSSDEDESTKTRLSQSREPRKRSLFWLLTRLTLSLAIGLLLGASVYLAPLLARDLLIEKLETAAQARGVALKIGAAYLDPFARLVLDDIVLRDPKKRSAPPFLKIQRLTVRFDVDGPSRPKVYLREVTIDGVALQLEREKDGDSNLNSLLEWFAARRQKKDRRAGSSGLRKYLSDHVPDLRVRDLSLAIDDHAGAPIRTASGINLRHLRAHKVSLNLIDRSPVREQLKLELDSTTHIDGLPHPIDLRGQLTWPERDGWLKLSIPPELTADLAGFRAGLSSIMIHSDGRVELLDIKAQRLHSSKHDQLGLTIEALRVRLVENPAPEDAIPERIRSRLPSAAVTLLQHVAEVSIHKPVIAGIRAQLQRKEAPDVSEDDSRSAQRRSRRQIRRLLPRQTYRTRDKPEKEVKKHKKWHAKVAKKAKPKEPDLRDGSKVRDALRQVFTQGADRLENGLADVRHFLAAQPVRLLSIHHGVAHYRDERAATASGQVSDFNARFERQPETNLIKISMDFNTSTHQSDNHISGQVDPHTGDAHFDLRLAHLRLAPYAAIVPVSVNLRGDSAVHDTKISLDFNAKDRQISLQGAASLAHLDISLPAVSRQEIEDLSLSARGAVRLDLKRGQLTLKRGELDLDKLRVYAEGSVERYRQAPAFNLEIKVPTIDCQDAVDALVGPVGPMLQKMRCKGNMSFRFDLSLDTADMKTLEFKFSPVLNQVVIQSLGRYIHFNVLSFPFEHHARQTDGSLYTFITGPGSERWASLPQISEYMVKVVNTTEDGAFWTHTGFSPGQIRNAMIANLERGRFVRGASTITQQVVKNLFFIEREKTLSRKIQEAVITWELERTLEKEQIMELYFNIIEFGPRIYGIRAAANHFFNRAPEDLSLLQCLWLGSIIPGPRRFYKQFTEGKVSNVWRKYICRLGDIMVKREKILPKERARLRECDVKFGGGNDGSEQPLSERRPWGLGHEGAFLPGMNPDEVIVPDEDEAAKAGVDKKDLP